MIRILDLFCGAGGAAVGYYRAFAPDVEIVGVDHKTQRRYPFGFVQADALEFMRDGRGDGFDLYHASPPCQLFTAMSVVWDRDHPDLLAPTRALLKATDKPYIIENVPGAPLETPVTLCGTMFGLLIIRHRLFETSPAIRLQPRPCRHERRVVKHGRPPDHDKHYHGVTGHFSDVTFARVAMDISWMVRDELAQAVPPAYTEWMGKRMKEECGW